MNNVIEELEADTQGFTIVNKLYEKIWKEFGEINKESIKVYQLWLLEQDSKICNKYMQIFKKTARESGYNSRFLIEKFK